MWYALVKKNILNNKWLHGSQGYIYLPDNIYSVANIMPGNQ